MGTILLYAIIIATSVSALIKPWVGILIYYLLAVLGPQYIWWWSFGDLRASLLVAAATLIGLALNIVRHQYDLSFLKTKQNLWLALLWMFITLSLYWGPYVSKFNANGPNPEQLLSVTHNMFVFYFCAVLAINDIKKVQFLGAIMIVSAAYLVYWANMQYLNENWVQFNMGRLMGPVSINGSSIYGDENAFAMLFITGLPFFYYFGYEIKQKFLRYLLWCLIPLGCHAVFLTGSRGGLLGLSIIVLYVVVKFKRRFVAIAILIGFFFFYQWQAGSIMKQRSETISGYQEDTSANMRLTAWRGGRSMIAAYPLTGVGLGSFRTALPDFIESVPMVAHNTVIQFAAESGVLAGVAYILIIYTFFKNSIKTNKYCKIEPISKDKKTIKNINDACTTSFLGMTVCALFLSLNVFEIFYFLLIINNTINVICNNAVTALPVTQSA